jgi:hypothetical protein
MNETYPQNRTVFSDNSVEYPSENVLDEMFQTFGPWKNIPQKWSLMI